MLRLARTAEALSTRVSRMRVSVTVVDPTYDVQRDVVVEADDLTPLGEVIDALHDLLATPSAAADPQVVSLSGHRIRAETAAGQRSPVYLRGAPLSAVGTWGESGITEGDLLSVGRPLLWEEPAGPVEVRVVGGRGAGAVHRLVPGDATIGSDSGCVICVDDHRVPPVCVVVSVGADGGAEVRAIEDAAAVLSETVPYLDPPLALDRVALNADVVTWRRGAQLRIGDILLELEETTDPDAAVDPAQDPGWLDYNRPPRLLAPERPTKFRLPSEPVPNRAQSIPWLLTLVPVAMALLFVSLTGRWFYMMFGLMSPMMMLGNYFQSKKSGKADYKAALADYQDKLAAVEGDVEQAVVDERSTRRLEAPDPALALLIATGPRGRLWERRTTDPDYLAVRVGVGDLPSEVAVEDPAQLEHRRQSTRTAYDVPITVPLRDRGVIGIAAADGIQRSLAAWALAQLAVLQSPRDTQFYVLTDHDSAGAWEWVRWLPHARPQNGQDTVVTIGNDAESCARRIAELSALLAARQQNAASDRSAREGFSDVVVVFDGARRLRVLPGVVALLKQGPGVGIYSLCLDTDERLLPEEASAVIVRTPQGVTLRQMRVTVVDRIVPDLVSDPWLHRVARSLAPLRDISGGETDSILPSGCRLTDVMGLEPLASDVIKARWALSSRTTSAVVGISLDGPFAIDLRRDGPHGLVAGTTGAGKSELLQTLVASLAVANRPDGMTFVLVDYKGGAAFKDCVDLPHTVGMVTDLDTHLVERALVSLGAELHRREHILAEAGAKDIEDYIDIAAKRAMDGRRLPDMPRLLIVIDEFASMARELPDFVTGLVNVAQRGRSLGIHLILATQRPSGVVSPEIRANTNLRIALRVTDASESSDVIDAPDAAKINKSHPGRAYVRLGATSLVPFQAGRVGGRRPGATSASAAAPWLAELPLHQLSQPVPARPATDVSDDAEITDLKVLVEAIRQAHDDLDLPPQHSPWLPALDTAVLLDDLLPDAFVLDYPAIPALPYAVEDLPAQQDRRHATIDFATFAHLAIMGGARSGRSQALRTIAAAAGQLTSPADVHVYGLDCGNGALLPLAELPHCGAVVQRTQTDRALRLFARLRQEMARRQELFGQGGYADLGEYRAAVAPDQRLPHILFLIDRWEAFMGGLAEADSGSPYDTVQTLLREGASVGIHLVITGDRSVVSARMTTLIEDKIALRIPDKNDYGLIGLHPRKMPDDIPEGRGFRSESGLELQFALLDADGSGQAQAARLRAIAADARRASAEIARPLLPFRLDVLPASISFDQAWELRTDPAPKPLWAMIGVGGDEMTALGLDLAYTHVAIVAGPPKSGRSTALFGMVESLLRGGTDVVIAAPRPSPLRSLNGRSGVRAVVTAVDFEAEEIAALMDPTSGPVALVIDDGELLKEVPAKDYLKSLVRVGGDVGQAIVLGGDVGEVASGFTGWQIDIKGRSGVLIQPQGITDGELIGARLPRSAAGASAPAGRAFAHLGGGALLTIQVPLITP